VSETAFVDPRRTFESRVFCDLVSVNLGASNLICGCVAVCGFWSAFVTMHSQRQALSIRRRVAASLYTGIAIVSLVLGSLLDAPHSRDNRIR
jgi:hypothetical protein